jgi:thiol-disulfide isomerase/thioredoxin
VTSTHRLIGSALLVLLAGGVGLLPRPTAGDESNRAAGGGDVTLEKLTFDELRSKVLVNKKARYTIVDAWATWCGPCKKNFPHVVEMHQKYGGKGLAVVSLSFDDPTNSKQVSEAEQFLKEKKAAFRNVLLNEEEGVGFEKLDINAIPAVFIYDPQGKEVKRFTLDDPDNQFTYDEVEKAVVGLLEGK